jgi:hypothetical protein
MIRCCLGTLVAALAALVLAPSASASCVAPPPLEHSLADAPIVFVGTVLRVTNERRTAIFRVERVWKGEVEGTVVVRGGPEGANVWSSVQRTYRAGKRYLVVPDRSQRDVFLDSHCSATRVYSPGLAELRPDHAESEPRGGAAGIGCMPWLQFGFGSRTAAAALVVLERFGLLEGR